MIISILEFSSVLFLGLLIGSLLTEAMVFLPLWKNMKPQVFLDSHQDAKPIIYRYFKPITILTTMTTISTAIYHITTSSFNILNIFPGIVGIMLLVIYFIFFKEANDNFSNGKLDSKSLPSALNKWSNWHWFRTTVGLFGFIVSIINISSNT